MSVKLKKVGGEYVAEETTLVTDIIDAALAPMGLFATDEVFVSQKVAGIAALGYMIGGVMVGDRFGDSIPLIGGKR